MISVVSVVCCFFITKDNLCNLCNPLTIEKLRVVRAIRWQRFTDETTVRIEIKVNINSKSWLCQL